jgi:hypothetical protein
MTVSSLVVTVNTGGKDTTTVPLPLQQTTGAKKITDLSGALPKKNASHQ